MPGDMQGSGLGFCNFGTESFKTTLAVIAFSARKRAANW